MDNKQQREAWIMQEANPVPTRRTIGHQLRDERLAKGLTVAAVVGMTRVVANKGGLKTLTAQQIENIESGSGQIESAKALAAAYGKRIRVVHFKWRKLDSYAALARVANLSETVVAKCVRALNDFSLAGGQEVLSLELVLANSSDNRASLELAKPL